MTRLRQLLSLPREVYELCVAYMPGEAGFALRARLYGKRVKSIGSNVLFDVGVKLEHPEYMTFGDNVWIDKYAVLLAGPPGTERLIRRKPNASFEHEEGELVIGDNCHIAPHVVITAHGGVSIGANSGVASGARIYSLSHHYRNPEDRDDPKLYAFTPMAPPADQALISAPVVIGENTAVALNAVVLPGTTVGRDAWIAVSAVVSKDVAPGMVASGNPAEPINARPGYTLPG